MVVGYSCRYYGHPAITDSSKIPDESYRRLTEINSRYYGLSLLRTYGHFIRSQRHNFIVFSLVVIADTEQHLGIFARFLRLSYLSFLVDFRFFCLSIKILCSLAAMNKFVQSVMIQMVDRPNTTPTGQDKKTLTFKALLLLISTFSKDLPFLYESRGGSLQISLSRS